MANANPSNRPARSKAKVEAPKQVAPEVEIGPDRSATPKEQEQMDAPYGRHTDGRPFDKGPKLDPATQSYFPAIWQEEVESVDNHGNRRTHIIVLEDR